MIKYSVTALLALALVTTPFSAYADLIPGDPITPTFENQQALILTLSVNGEPLVDNASGTFPPDTSVEVSYAIALGTKDYPDQSDTERVAILESILEDNRTYLELWRGTPFTADASFVSSQELLPERTGLVTMYIPDAGAYFFLLYIGDEVRDHAAYCEKYEVNPVDCVDPTYFVEHTPEEVHPYFTYALGSPEWTEFDLAPLWSGIRFTLEAPSEGAPNILFIPGFAGSRLYAKDGQGNERRLWEPNGNQDIRDLALDTRGQDRFPVYTRDIVDSLLDLPLGFTVHEEFMEYLDGLEEDGKINDWKGYSYDWRHEVFDVVDNGALKEDGSREYLGQVVEELAASSKNGKVAIVTHSNGGLVAKALMVRLEAAGKAGLVDKIVMIAAPQAGTPKGMVAALHGRDELLNYVFPPVLLRESLLTMPGAYGLMPSAAYFNEEPADVATFAPGSRTDSFIGAFGGTLDSYSEFKDFIENIPETRPIEPDDAGTPLSLSAVLINKTRTTHRVLDTWQPPEGVEVHEIAGWGQPTISVATYHTVEGRCLLGKLFCTQAKIEYELPPSHDGDGTVMSLSALLQGRGKYFNLHKLAEEFDQNRKHLNITEPKFIHEYIGNLIGTSIDYDKELFTSSKPEEVRHFSIIGVHSPAILHATDSEGNVTGVFLHPNNEFMYVREEIPGSNVEFGGEAKYLILPVDEDYDITIKGTGSGTFSVTVTDGDGSVNKIIADLPITPSTEATIELSNGSAGQLQLDVDGDGKNDANVSDSLTRGDAINLCKKAVDQLPQRFIKFYLNITLSHLERWVGDDARFTRFVSNAKKYVEAIQRAIPQGNAEAIAQCLYGLENSKK